MLSLTRSLNLLALCFLTTATPQTTSVPGISNVPSSAANLPDCATPALISVLTTSGCGATDTKCLCSKPDLQPFLNNAVQKACSNTNDQNTVKTFAASFCSDSSTSSTSSSMTMTSSMGAMSPGNLTTAGGNSTMTNSTTSSASYSSPAPSAIMIASTSAGASASLRNTSAAAGVELGLSSISALIVAIGALVWVFAEL
ncbi:Hypothetical predicted protein [Lecanosticta acicola]|uniref:CFEM domain-containing protein n=1 Tax=Lecanosticta acicola TaxID=111012 RepID=A0AAI8YSH8_9PEZI|nr:Hypothetical predicted protein [Lecanosticta acicola]